MLKTRVEVSTSPMAVKYASFEPFRNLLTINCLRKLVTFYCRKRGSKLPKKSLQTARKKALNREFTVTKVGVYLLQTPTLVRPNLWLALFCPIFCLLFLQNVRSGSVKFKPSFLTI